MKISFTLTICLLVSAISLSAQRIQPKGKILLSPFNLQEVKLTESKWQQQVIDTKNYYLNIPNDDLLKGFRKRAHLNTYGAQDLGGWYSHDYWHPFGQFISGLSRMYAATRDEACKNKIDALIKGWAECIDTSGYFFYTDTPNATHYIYEKTLCGLIDAYTYADNTSALHYAGIITDWAIKHLSRNLAWAGEWYTLPENLYKAYFITGDKKYYDFVKEWEYTRFWNGIKNDSDIYKVQFSYHAYSHLNTFSSAAAAYLATGDDAYKQTIIKAYDYFNQQQCYPTGGFGPNEALMADEQRINSIKASHWSFETQCGSWAIFKLCKYLLMITDDARYGDWIEKAMINGIGASIPMSADGKVMYYSDYNMREGFKRNTTDAWTCCTGTRIQAVPELQDLIYFKTTNGLYVNLFVPSVVHFNNLEFVQSTSFPESNKTVITVHADTKASKETVLYVRKPGWLSNNADIILNGKKINATVSNGWYIINNKWKDGDKIEIQLPIQFSYQQVSSNKTFPVTLMYGPVAMAVRCGTDNYPMSLLRTPQPWSTFSSIDGQVNNYHTSLDTSLLIRPFYDFKENEHYVILLDSSVQQYIPIHNLDTTGNWRVWFQLTDETGATIKAKFSGTGFKLTAYKSENAGMFSLTIDGEPAGVYDEYSKDGGLLEAKVDGLTKGNHVAVITTLKETNESSKGRFVNYGTIEKID